MSDGSNATAHNKQRVREVIDKIVNGGDADLADSYYREDYIQHDPHVPQVFRIEDGMMAEHWDVVQLSQGGA
jgi:predicted SnoaL-like aldol condensation-catalyzing enzyme